MTTANLLMLGAIVFLLGYGYWFRSRHPGRRIYRPPTLRRVWTRSTQRWEKWHR